MSLISGIAGIDLVPAIDLEIGHINLSVKSEEQTRKEIDAIDRQKRFFEDDEGISGCPWEDDKPIVGWHTDSYPFVVVLMLSDCTNMVGGETALKTGTGEVLKVRGPGMVSNPVVAPVYDGVRTNIPSRDVPSSCRVDTSPIKHSEPWVPKSESPL